MQSHYFINDWPHGVRDCLGTRELVLELHRPYFPVPRTLNALANNNLVGYYSLVEKGTPHCKLSFIHTLIHAGKVRTTVSALAGGAAMGFDVDGIVGIVTALTPKDFHKSMTTHGDHRVWQDVYRPTTPTGEVYVKLTVIEDVLIVSFKEL